MKKFIAFILFLIPVSFLVTLSVQAYRYIWFSVETNAAHVMIAVFSFGISICLFGAYIEIMDIK